MQFKNEFGTVIDCDAELAPFLVGFSAVDNDEPSDSGSSVEDSDADNDVPDGSVREIVAWVGDDVDRARRAVAAEKKREHPRVSVQRDLDHLLND